jgi:hypothetical protein
MLIHSYKYKKYSNRSMRKRNRNKKGQTGGKIEMRNSEQNP